jgi:hypothetical protein
LLVSDGVVREYSTTTALLAPESDTIPTAHALSIAG